VPTNYAVQRGYRYIIVETLEVHQSMNGARDAVIVFFPNLTEQDPPATGFEASYIDAAFEFAGIKAIEVLAP
jgi:hypothetical protein